MTCIPPQTIILRKKLNTKKLNYVLPVYNDMEYTLPSKREEWEEKATQVPKPARPNSKSVWRMGRTVAVCRFQQI